VINAVASALEVLHADGRVHLGSKPTNVIVQEVGGLEPHVWLTDLDLVDREGYRDLDEIINGTLDYPSPEPISGKDSDWVSKATSHALFGNGVDQPATPDLRPALIEPPPFPAPQPELPYPHLDDRVLHLGGSAGWPS
jgi:hypothetical protein